MQKKRSLVVLVIVAFFSLFEWARESATPPSDPARPGERAFAGAGFVADKASAQQSDPKSQVDPDVVPDVFYVATATTPGGACATMVGQRGSWVGTRLYPALQDDGHCRYRWQPRDPPAPPERNLLLQNPNLREVRPDPPVVAVEAPVVPLDEPQTQAWLSARHDVMRARLGEPSLLERVRHRRSVRVAVIDSAKGDRAAGFQDRVGHGENVARVIEDVACTGQPEPCANVEVRAYAALRLAASRANGTQEVAEGAGMYGTPGAVAEQIVRATDDWLADRDLRDASGKSIGPAHLVVNLSLGWSGCFMAPPWTAKPWDPYGDPVQRAILYARCHGALVIAAAGNIEAVPGCPKAAQVPREKPVERAFPAQFANALPPPAGADPIRGELPSPASCQKVGVFDLEDDELGSLALGIGAVDEFDEKLAIAAQEATLVSHGNTVSAPDPANGGFRNNLSGTSMSTATVSGIAAAVWASFPARSAAEVERDLIEPAVVLRTRAADQPFLCNKLPGSNQDDGCKVVRRASLCRSLAHARNLRSKCGPDSYQRTPVPWPLAKVSAPVADNQCPVLGSASGPCAPPSAKAIDSTEQPWGYVAPTPPGDSCGTCVIYDIASPRVFSARFVNPGAVDSDDGYVQFGPRKYALWNHLGAPTTSLALCPTPDIKAGGLLHYVMKTPEGEVHDYESLVIEQNASAPIPDGSECTPAP